MTGLLRVVVVAGVGAYRCGMTRVQMAFFAGVQTGLALGLFVALVFCLLIGEWLPAAVMAAGIGACLLQFRRTSRAYAV
jgi:hypothetical protein